MSSTLIPDPSLLKILGFFLTTPLLMLAAWVKFKHGTFSLSQGRTQRLYDLMLTQTDWDAVPSGALQLAVESALSVELAGDKIRYALRRDRPLAVLQALKMTKQVIKLSPDGRELIDGRKHPRWSFKTRAWVSAGLLFVVYAFTVVTFAWIAKGRLEILGPLFGFQLLTSLFLVPNTTQPLAAGCLLNPTFYRLPAKLKSL